MRTMIRVLVVVGVSALLVGVGCGSDPDPDESDPGNDGSGSEGAGAGDTSSSSSSSSGSSSSSSSSGTGGEDAMLECKTQAASQPDPACADCACDNCLAELEACEDNEGCVALRDCAVQASCCDELCVLFACGPELETAGGISGEGTTLAAAVRDCTEASSCSCCE